MSATISEFSSLDRPRGSMKSSSRSSSIQHLQRFVEAKRKIGEVFTELEEYVGHVAQFLSGSEEKAFIDKEHIEEARKFKDSVVTIKDMLERDHMKVVFFGRTSNGKSTVINAMLHHRVLPQGMGHTTSCFVQVEGSNASKKFLLEGASPERKNIESLDQIADALNSKQLGEDALVRVLWPKTDSRLLQNEVTFLDSPGVDLSPEFDGWIDKHCLDADVFVLVCNAESTLTQAEKNFFHRVSSKLSRPNIFVLNNRWDASASEPENIDKVRYQHMTRFTKFLVDELKVCTAEDIRNRVFFVSAKEVLHQRLKNKGVATPTTFLADGHPARAIEFESFEEQFETCISESAIHTKFESHVRKARDITQRVHEMLTELDRLAHTEREEKSEAHKDKLRELKESQESIRSFLKKSQDRMQKLSSEVQLKVGSDFSEEIRRLSAIIEDFTEVHFNDEEPALSRYKKCMIEHIDETIANELKTKLTGDLLPKILKIENDIVEGICQTIPEPRRNKARSVTQYREAFAFSVVVPCAHMAEDFNEDLEFRFSLGLSQLIKRFLSLKNGTDPGPNPGRLPFGAGGRMIVGDSQTVRTAADVGAEQEDIFMKSLIMSSASYVANGGVGLLIVGGLVYRTLGWKIIAGVGAAYGGLYLYERLCWNASAKEQQFRDQLRWHLEGRMRQLSHTLIINCENQVSREVQDVLTRSQGISSEIHQEMKSDVDSLMKEVKRIETLSKELSQTKGRAKFIAAQLNDYERKYLEIDSTV